ncbi:MAG: peptidoglycan DD-metalloendopeptidase family protein [Anaerolineae bacterium]
MARSISDGLSPVREYEVQAGETLWDIADKLGVTVRELIAANLVRVPDGVFEGQKLRIPIEGDLLNLDFGLSESSIIEGGQYMVQPGDNVHIIASRYGLDVDGLRLANDLENDIIYVGQVLLLPDKEEFLLPAVGEMRWPFYRRNWSYTVSQGYKKDHAGVDFVLEEGVPIRAVADGYVTYAGWDDIGYGNMVMVFHGDNFYTLYAHLSEIKVKRGQKVDRENILGLSGDTGNSSNPHLHFEIREGFLPLNPCIYLPEGC